MKMTEEELQAKRDKEFADMMDEYTRVSMEIEEENNKAYRCAKENITYDVCYIDEVLEGCSWHDKGIVELFPSDYKSGSYPNHSFYREKDGYHNYMKQYEDENFHCMVAQWSVGDSGDSFEGIILFPLKDGRYWKVDYSC